MLRRNNNRGVMAKQRTQTIKEPWSEVVDRYFINQWRAFVSSIKRLLRTPFTTLLILTVIGVSFALPAGLYILLQNVERLSGSWQPTTQISVFLQQSTDQQHMQNLMQLLKQRKDIARVRYISPEEGLKELQQTSDIGEVIAALQNNPLPGVIAIQPNLQYQTPETLSYLLQDLRALPEVDVAELDMQWVERLYAVLALGRHGIIALAALLGLGVLLIIGNTIRLATENDKSEIIVMKLFGATSSYIRRPFLYIGIWYGLFGGLIAWGLVSLTLWWLNIPVQQLAMTYGSTFQLQSLEWATDAALLLTAVLLGYCGAWLAVARHLRG